ncbi:hypothetical protein [Actinoplanes sp. L3-i22]|nr:hypothetical protein [Actinoplanes sp. L3-i22]
MARAGLLVNPGGTGWLPATFGACALVCAGNLFWAVKNRRPLPNR